MPHYAPPRLNAADLAQRKVVLGLIGPREASEEVFDRLSASLLLLWDGLRQRDRNDVERAGIAEEFAVLVHIVHQTKVRSRCGLSCARSGMSAAKDPASPGQ